MPQPPPTFSFRFASLDGVVGPVAAAALDGQFIDANTSAFGLFDHSKRGECKIWEAYHEDGPITIARADFRRARASAPYRFSKPLPDRAPGVAAIEWSAVKSEYAGGKCLIFFGRYVADAEALAADAHAYARAIYQTTPEGLLLVAEDGDVEQASPAALRLFDLETCDGVNINGLFPDTDFDDEALYPEQKNRQGGREANQDSHPGFHLVTGRKAAGEIFNCEISIARIAVHGRLIRTIVVHDADARGESARELLALQDLTHSARIALLAEMATTIVHEVKQPLSAAVTFVHAAKASLRKREANALEIELLVKASDQIERAGEIVRHMRTLIRRGESRREIVDLNVLVRDATVFALIGDQAPQVDLKYDLGNAPLNALVDPVQIEQVVVNLVRNSVEAMAHQDNRIVRITTRTHENEAVITVADNGPGIPDAILNRLFKPFATTKEDGVGLGLSICKRIINAHDGTMAGGNRDAGGAQFKIRLPLSAEGG